MTATLTVWKFSEPTGAEEAESRLLELQKGGMIAVLDAAVVSWPAGEKRPKTRQLHNLVRAGALSGSFWGLLFGLLFFMPLLGMAIGAISGAIGGKFADIGIDDGFIEKVRSTVTEGTSALFVLSAAEVWDRIRTGMPEGELVYTNLSGDQEQKLREVFAEHV